MGNWPVAFRSAANRQNASAQAITAAGVSKDAIARATCWFLRRFWLYSGAGTKSYPDNHSVRISVYQFPLQTYRQSNHHVMKMLKTALIGTGFMGKVHAENLRRLGTVEIVALAGSSERTRARVR